MSTSTKRNIGFALKGIEIIDLQLIHPEKAMPEDVVFDFDIDINHRVNIENELVFVVSNVTVFMEKELKLGQVKLSCVFHITDFKNLLDDNQKLDLSEDVVITFNSISISTTRGVMFSEFRGTFLHNAIIPLIDPKGLSSRTKNTGINS
jgi:hypothetical protein